MILFYARKRYATCSSDDRLTTGSVGVEVVFHFSDDWAAAPARIAVFRGSGVSVDVALLEDSCTVPPEVLTQPGSTLTIGVYGTDGTGTVVIPTVYAEAGRIVRGAKPSGIEPTPETQPLIDQLLAAAKAARDAAGAAERLAQSIRDDADNGEFDGSPGANGSGIWYTKARISGDENPFVRRRDLIGREGAEVQVHDLLLAPDVGDEGEPTTLYEITSVGTACTLKRLCKMQGEGGGGGITVDDELSGSSTNPVQNKVIKAALDGKYTKPSSGIPKTDLAANVQASLDKADNALPKSGGTMTGPVDMGGSKISNLEPGTNDADAVTLAQMSSAISQSAAYFRGSFATRAALLAVAWQTTDPAAQNYVTNNDYAVVLDDETQNDECWRYLYVSGTGWTAQYKINETPLTQAQLDALNSGATAQNISAIAGKITAPASANVGDFLVYTANGWAAQTVPSAQGVNF